MLINTWDKELSDEESLRFLSTIAREHSLDAGSSGEIIRRLIDGCDWSGLVHFEYDNTADDNVYHHIHARQALGFFQKLEWLDVGIDKEAAAVAKFEQGERACRETNIKLARIASGEISFEPDVNRIIHAASRKIADLLGDVPKLSELKYTFGPGANGSVPKRMACPRVKLGAPLACSANAVGLLPSFLREVPHWEALHINHVYIDSNDDWLYTQVAVEIQNSQLAFATKNAKTHRGINTEPSINGVIQRGYGEVIFQKLKSVGIDLRNQDSNKQAARRGSLTGALATLDLVNSSGLICKRVPELLLPYDWWARLSDLRSPKADYVRPDGKTVTYELECFSTMGNGYTFPLQSLIYWALVTSCCAKGDEVRIYGDDIICPVDHVPLVLKVFSALGFEVNTEKSFWEGPFRESCGGDYYLGVDIRPFYQKKHVSGRTLFALHNYYIRAHMFEYAKLVRDFIAPELQIFGPDGYGDGHLVAHDWTRVQHKRELGWGGYVFDTFKDVGNMHQETLPGDRVLPVYTVYANQCEMELDDITFPDTDVRGHGIDPNTGATYAEGVAEFARNFKQAPLPLPTTVIKSKGKPIKVQTQDGRIVNKKRTLQPLPGVAGYKRISIYILA